MSSNQYPPTDPIPERGDVAKGLRTVFLNRAAHMGIMLDRTNRNLRRAEQLERFAATGKVSTLEEAPSEDDMGVYVGNEYHYHEIQQPPPAATVPPPTATPPIVVTPTPPVKPCTPDIRVTPFTPRPQQPAPTPTQPTKPSWWQDLGPIGLVAGPALVALAAYMSWPDTPTPPSQPVQESVDGEIGVTIR